MSHSSSVVCVGKAEVKQATAGNASIGGPFDLLNQDGKPFTDKDLLGKFALVYFGFTHCPDICPDELEKMASALNGLGAPSAPPPPPPAAARRAPGGPSLQEMQLKLVPS